MSSDGATTPAPDAPEEAVEPLPGEPAEPSKRESTERLALRVLQQLNQIREVRTTELTEVAGSVPAHRTHDKVRVPYGIELATAWSWRLLLIAAAGLVVAQAIGFLELVVLPVIVALLITALVVPVVNVAQRLRIPRGIASLLVVAGVIAVVAAMLTFAGHQVATGASDLANQAASGLQQIRDWMTNGPLHASNTQIDHWLNSLQDSLLKWGKDGSPVTKVTAVGTVALDVVAAMFIILFSTYFFLAEGSRIWTWIVRLVPQAARPRVDSSGKVAWISLTQFVRATVIVAATDAIGIMIVAAFLGVPFVAAIGMLVFLGAFVPMLGATVAGTVAVLVALVDQGPVTALFMLVGVIFVQQLEAHALQPFLLGRWVRVHPLAVILAIATGVLVAGIPGALVAVPLAAASNAVALHLSSLGDMAKEREGLDAPL